MRIDVLSNLIFKGSYFPNENILRKSKKNGRAVNTLLGIGVFILVEKLTDKKFIGKKHEHVSTFKSFFNVKNLRIYSFFSNSDFTIKNLDPSQLWGSTQISITYSIKYTFWRLKKVYRNLCDTLRTYRRIAVRILFRAGMHTSLTNDVWTFINAQSISVPLTTKRVIREIG